MCSPFGNLVTEPWIGWEPVTLTRTRSVANLRPCVEGNLHPGLQRSRLGTSLLQCAQGSWTPQVGRARAGAASVELFRGEKLGSSLSKQDGDKQLP